MTCQCAWGLKLVYMCELNENMYLDMSLYMQGRLAMNCDRSPSTWVEATITCLSAHARLNSLSVPTPCGGNSSMKCTHVCVVGLKIL